MSSRLFKYLASERGRSLSFNVVAATSIAMFSASYLPGTIGIDKLREFLQLYNSGLERKVPDKIRRRFEQAILACNCNEFERSYVKPFMAYGFDTVQIGSIKSRFGALVGVPANYEYDTPASIETNKIQLKGENIAWSSPDGQKLREALVLTEDEQIFGIARSILQAKSHKLMIGSMYAPISLFAVYAMGVTINRRGQLYGRPLGVRGCLYAILATFGVGLYSFLTDYTQVYYDTEIDKALCDAGPEMVEAGVRFYQKMLQKNIAIRTLSADTSYTVSGNENFGIRQKSMPLTMRKSYFEIRLRELQDGGNQATEQAAATA